MEATLVAPFQDSGHPHRSKLRRIPAQPRRSFSACEMRRADALPGPVIRTRGVSPAPGVWIDNHNCVLIPGL